jgi:hypothetical protein
VTYTPPGQELTVAVNMQITAGWCQGKHYGLDHARRISGQDQAFSLRSADGLEAGLAPAD